MENDGYVLVRRTGGLGRRMVSLTPASINILAAAAKASKLEPGRANLWWHPKMRILRICQANSDGMFGITHPTTCARTLKIGGVQSLWETTQFDDRHFGRYEALIEPDGSVSCHIPLGGCKPLKESCGA